MKTPTQRPTITAELHALKDAVQELRSSVVETGSAHYDTWRWRLNRRNFRFSAFNLAAYIALLRHDADPEPWQAHL